MLNKLKRTMIMGMMTGLMVLTPLSAQATTKSADNNARAGSASTVAVDSSGNKYTVSASCSASGKSGQASTSFKISLYKDGTYSANSLYKTISAQGSIGFSNSAVYSGSKKSKTVTGASGSITASYSGLAYNATSIAAQHSFSCNGASKSLYTNR